MRKAALLLGLMLITIPVLATNFYIEDVDYSSTYSPGELAYLKITLVNDHEKYHIEDLDLCAWLEDDHGDRVTDKAKYRITDLADGREKEVILGLLLPSDLDEDTYELVVRAEGKWENGEKASTEYRDELEVERAEHVIRIIGIESDKQDILPGQTLDLGVKIANYGLADESGLKLRVAVPKLGIKKELQLLEPIIENDEYTAYFSIDIPEDAKAGIYDLKINVWNDVVGDEYVTNLFVGKSEISSQQVQTNLIQTAEAKINKPVTFELTLTNNQKIPKTYSLQLVGASDWTKTARVDPEELTLEPGDSEIISVYLLPIKGGAYECTLYIKENGAIVGQVDLSVDVEGKSTLSGGNNLVGLVLVGLIGIAILVYLLGGRQIENLGKKPTRKSKIYY